MVYSQFYSDSTLTYQHRAGKILKMIEAYDLHYLGGGSDKVYVLTLQEEVENDGSKSYHAVCFYGRRFSGCATNHLGKFNDLASAHKEMTKQLNAKRKKGYKDTGHYLDEDAKASASGALGRKVLEFLRESYPTDAFAKNPKTGAMRRILGINEAGALRLMDGPEPSQSIEIPFGKYGMLEVVK